MPCRTLCHYCCSLTGLNLKRARSPPRSQVRRDSWANHAQQRSDQRVDVLAGVIECQLWTDRALNSEAAQDGLGTVVPGAHGDALLIECFAHLLSRHAFEDEGDHYRSFPPTS